MKFNENESECINVFDKILPYLMIICFLLGYFLVRNLRIQNEYDGKDKKYSDKLKQIHHHKKFEEKFEDEKQK